MIDRLSFVLLGRNGWTLFGRICHDLQASQAWETWYWSYSFFTIYSTQIKLERKREREQSRLYAFDFIIIIIIFETEMLIVIW